MDIFSWHIDPAWVYYPAAVVFVLLCIAAWLTTLLTLPGNWIVVALAAGFAWLFSADAGYGIEWRTVVIAAVLAGFGELIEFGAGAAGAAKQGASRRAVGLSLVGAMVGSVGGLFVGVPIPIVGPLIVAVLGGAVGAFVGAYIGETWKGRTEDERIAAGRGAFVGKLWGTLGKLTVGAVIVAVVAVDAFR
jgi:uncharacterized protein